MSLSARLFISTAANLLVLAGMIALVFLTVRTTDQVYDQRRAARSIMLSAETLFSDLKDAETGQRGFLLTGLDRYLEPFTKAQQDLPIKFRQVRDAIGDDRVLGLRTDRLQEIANDKLKELRETIEIRRNSGLEPTLKLVLTDRGKELMDRARDAISEIQAIEFTRISAIERNLAFARQALMLGLILGGAFVAATSILTTLWIKYSWGRPLSALQNGVGRIADGNIEEDIRAEGQDELNKLGRAFNAMMKSLRLERTSRVKAEQELAESAATLRLRSDQLEQRNRMMDLLGQFANRLPGCIAEDELKDVITCFAPQILRGLPGAVYVLTNSEILLRRLTEWNDPVGSHQEFKPMDCWGLRRGQPHIIANKADDINCAHLDTKRLTGYQCLPLVAQGETVGMLYIEMPEGSTDLVTEDLQVMTETIAFSLINLRLREKLRNQSIRDPLTGLFNRRYFEESLELEASRSERSASPLSLVMLDVDHFKMFNDTFGHEAGDVVLKRLADLLKKTIRQGDVACRFGGEEFTLLLPGASAETAMALSERVRLAVEKLDVTHRGESLGKLSISLGVAEWLDCHSPSELVRLADEALYMAKEAGRNRTMHHTQSSQRLLEAS